RSPFTSDFMWDGDTIRPRQPVEQVKMRTCWGSFSSNGPQFYSTAHLAGVWAPHRLTSIAHGSDRLRVRYSINVRQHVLTEDHYNYLALMEKNTRQNGTFFDPMPAQLRSNIHNVTNTDEIVVGYVGVYTT